MRVPWVNILLLFLVSAQFVTGYWGMVNGREGFRWVLWLHGIGAYTLLLLLFRKSDIILDVWRRKSNWSGSRLIFLATVVVLLSTLTLGLIWTFQGPVYLFGFSLLSIHIYLAIPLTALIFWHSWRMRFIWRVPGALGRRLFLNGVSTSLAGALLWRVSEWSKLLSMAPGINRRFTGSYEIGAMSDEFPVVSWIADDPDPVKLDEWQLIVSGEVERALSFTYAQLRRIADDRLMATLDCTSGWYTTQEWGGVMVSRLLEMAGIKDSAASVTFGSATGYQRRFSLVEANSFLLALDLAGMRLSHGHGAPLRLVALDKRGLEWVKWVQSIHLNTTGKHWQSPLPLQ